jgi:transcriptional regulator with XRE-family HTH domain
VPGKRTTKALSAELPRLLKASGVTLRALANAIGVNQSYLSRILGARGTKAARTASPKVAAVVAEYFDLPRDYFGEYRESVVHDAVADHPGSG